MSLNPFHRFRKHQKTLLAGLTIMTMFLFILSFGHGDITSLFVGRGNPAKPVARIHGEPIYLPDVQQLSIQRQLASTYAVRIVIRSHHLIMTRAEAELVPVLKEKEDEELKSIILRLVEAWKQAFPPDGKESQLSDFYQYNFWSAIPQNLASLQGVEKKLPKDGSEKLPLVQLLIVALEQDRRALPLWNPRMGRYAPPDTFAQGWFGGGSMFSARELLDFRVWLAEADRLGIQVTTETLKEMIEKEALGEIKGVPLQEEAGQALKGFGHVNPSTDMLKNALRDEYRVRLARVAVLGYDAIRGNTISPPVTPYDLDRYFVENRTEKNFMLLPVPVNRTHFVTQVPDASDAELQKFFDRYKYREDDAGSREPGFKQPARRTIEWVGASPDSEFYKAEAKKTAEKMREAAMVAMQVFAGSLSATGQAPAASLVSVLPNRDDVVLAATYFENTKFYHRTPSFLAPALPTAGTNLHDTSLNRPENVAALVGQALGAGGTQGTMLSAPGAFLGAGYWYDSKKRSELWSQLVLAGATPLPWTAAGMAYAMRPESEYVPLEKIRGAVEQDLLKQLARRQVFENLKTVGEELDRLHKESGAETLQRERASNPKLLAATIGEAVAGAATGDPLAAGVAYAAAVKAEETRFKASNAAAQVLDARFPILRATEVASERLDPQNKALIYQRIQKYLAEAVKTYGLEHGQSEKPRDRYDVAEDPGLKPLQERFKQPWNHGAAKPKAFSSLFFDARDRPMNLEPYAPQALPAGDFRGLPQRGLDEWHVSRNPSLYWMTSEVPAYVPKFHEVEARVKERWKITQARKMAKKDADAIAAEVKKAAKGDGKTAVRLLRDQAEKMGVSLIDLDRVSRLTSPRAALMDRDRSRAEYQPYRIPEDKVEYPSGLFLSQLLKLKNEGDVVLLADRPETTYYVAVLENPPLPPDLTEFGRHEGQLLARYEEDEHPRVRFIDGIMEQLRQSAKLVILDETFEKRFGRSGGGDFSE